MKTILMSLTVLSTTLSLLAQPKPARAQAVELWLNQGQALIQQRQPEQALVFFRQAAAAGDSEGAFIAGKLLLEQAARAEGMERVRNSHDGIEYLFCAATNHHAGACAQLSRASLAGTGLKADRVAAYAWLKIASELDPVYKGELDRMVIRLEPKSVTRAQSLAAQWLKGAWPMEAVQPVEFGDARLKVQGKSIGSSRPMVIVNGNTFGPEDTDEVLPANAARNPKTPRLTITCLEIGEDYILVQVAGERSLKLLPSGPA